MNTKTFNCTLTFELEGETEEQVRRELQDMIDAAAYDASFFTVVRRKAKTPLSAEHFWELFHDARAAAIAELGERWVFTSADNCCWLEVSNKLRRFRGPKGTVITNPRDIRAPAPRFWPNGIPSEITIRPDFPRERGTARITKRCDRDNNQQQPTAVDQLAKASLT